MTSQDDPPSTSSSRSSASRCGVADTDTLTLPVVAQAYEGKAGRVALVQTVRDTLDATAVEPQEAHRLIARLTKCNLLVTTSLDSRLRLAFDEVARPLDSIVSGANIPFEDERRPRLYKLRGALDRPESVILTEDDFERFFDDAGTLSIVLQGDLARKTILFLGYDLSDPHFRRLYRKVTVSLDSLARRAYCSGEILSEYTLDWCKRREIEVIESDATSLLAELTQELLDRAHPIPATATAPSARSTHPSHPSRTLHVLGLLRLR